MFLKNKIKKIKPETWKELVIHVKRYDTSLVFHAHFCTHPERPALCKPSQLAQSCLFFVKDLYFFTKVNRAKGITARISNFK